MKKVTAVLDEAGIDYMMTGSLVSSLQGEPRSTHDIDLVISLTEKAIGKLLQAFPPPDFFLSEQAMHTAIQQRSMFNLLAMAEGEKVDFWLLTEDPFDQARFARKRQEEVLGMSLKISTPEDTILAKLRWAKLAGGSDKQFTDALRVYEVQKNNLDLDYINTWALQLEVLDLWQQLQTAAEAADP